MTTRARSDGIAVIGGADVLVQDAVVIIRGPRRHPPRRLTGAGPYRVGAAR